MPNELDLFPSRQGRKRPRITGDFICQEFMDGKRLSRKTVKAIRFSVGTDRFSWYNGRFAGTMDIVLVQWTLRWYNGHFADTMDILRVQWTFC